MFMDDVTGWIGGKEGETKSGRMFDGCLRGCLICSHRACRPKVRCVISKCFVIGANDKALDPELNSIC
jgi:hypothetical protein